MTTSATNNLWVHHPKCPNSKSYLPEPCKTCIAIRAAVQDNSRLWCEGLIAHLDPKEIEAVTHYYNEKRR